MFGLVNAWVRSSSNFCCIYIYNRSYIYIYIIGHTPTLGRCYGRTHIFIYIYICLPMYTLCCPFHLLWWRPNKGSKCKCWRLSPWWVPPLSVPCKPLIKYFVGFQLKIFNPCICLTGIALCVGRMIK